MSEDVFPRRNLPADAEPWGRKQDDVTRSQGRRITALELASQSNNRSNAGQLGVIGRQLDALEAQQVEITNTVAALGVVVADLQDAGKLYEASAAGPWAGDAWASGTPSVTASSRSRRFRVTITAAAAGATSLFTFSTTGYPRDRIIGSSASAVLSRISATGGASSTNTAYGTWVVTMPSTGSYTFRAEARGTTGFSSSEALGISVEPLL